MDEREKKVKVYRQKYDVYLQVKPVTNSPFDALIAAAQVIPDESRKEATVCKLVVVIDGVRK